MKRSKTAKPNRRRSGFAVVSVALGLMRRLRLPSLQQFIVVDRNALRLFVGELALRRQRAVLLGFGVPVFGVFFLVELRSEFALNAGALQARHDRVLICLL